MLCGGHLRSRRGTGANFPVDLPRSAADTVAELHKFDFLPPEVIELDEWMESGEPPDLANLLTEEQVVLLRDGIRKLREPIARFAPSPAHRAAGHRCSGGA